MNYKVTAIRDGDGSSLPGVFQGNSTITGITLPNTLTYIGDNTFVNANGLQGDLKIPASVVTIGTNAFSQQDQLTGRIEFEGALDGKSKLTTIRQNAFRRVQKAERTLIIPASVETIELSAFYQVGASGRLGSGLIFVGANDGTSHLSSIGSGTAGGFVGTFRYSAFSGKILFPASLLSISRGFIEVNDPVEVAFAAGSQLTTIGG
ncbi:MAG: leucine-rich repeat domain-containing protein [Candidatus Peribacteria bacterium]|nr:leucine-rich repeat domain-containing protein [Candidatus Peribacteria bacterium]